MDALCFNDDKKDGVEAKPAEVVPTSDLSDMDDEFGEQQVAPRVGDEFQAEIPSLVTAFKLTVKLRESYKQESSRRIGIPLMQPNCKVQNRCKTSESVTSDEGKLNVEDEQKVGRFSNLQSSFEFDETAIDSLGKVRTELSDKPWTDIECDSFLLGLYAFGKNLNHLKRFVGSRSMGDILSFYYGKFYRSEGYCRWSKCRKMRGRRRIFGRKIFIGWRQQELLSRLISHVSGERQTVLVELSRNFGEGKMPFEDYVFALKEAVGIDLFVAAVGVGKGKKDLISTAGKPTKTNNIFSARPEIPIGKACSSLTSAEIIKLLTGDFRLSKARSNALFWEAVWPRLVAKGWHSKQHTDHAVSTSKQSCVFLLPGIKKFSRKLVKGNHYFDSISDVLNKVASDPMLLEIETQATEGSGERENAKAKQNLDGLSNKPQFCYLQSLSSKGQDPMEATIVDTSTVSNLDKCEMRQLESSVFPTLSISQETEEDRAEDSSDKSVKLESSDCTHTHEAVNSSKEEEPSSEINEHRFVQNLASDCSKYLPPIMKRQNLTTAGKNGELSDCAESTLMDKDFDDSNSPSYHFRESESTPDMSNEGSATENHTVREVSAEKPKTKMVFDLNLPFIPPETEMEVPSQNIEDQCENTSEEGDQPIAADRRHSTRNRPLTRKALEALEYRMLNSKRKRKNSSESSQNDSNSQSFDLNIAPCDDGGIDLNVMAMEEISIEKENVIQIQACRINIDLNAEPEYCL